MPKFSYQEESSLYNPNTYFEEPEDEEPYDVFLVHRNLVRDPSLSINLRWFLIYCMSNKKGWKILPKFIMKSQGFGRKKFYSIVNEGIERGYIKRERRNDAKGYLFYTYFVSKTPRFLEFKPCDPNPSTDLEHTKDKVSIIDSIESITDRYEKKRERNLVKEGGVQGREPEKNCGGKPPNPPLVSFELEKGKLKLREYRNLIEEFGKTCVDKTIDRILLWEKNNPKAFSRWKDHDARLKKWILDDKAKSFDSFKAKKIDENKIMISDLSKACPFLVQRGILYAGNHVEIIYQGRSESWKWEEQNLLGKIELACEKFNIPFINPLKKKSPEIFEDKEEYKQFY